MNDSVGSGAPDVLLLIATGCAHCATNLKALSGLVKDGVIGRLEVINIAHHPEVAAEQRVRSVPWTFIGPFRLDGARSAAELTQWAGRVSDRDGMAEYFRELFAAGKLAEVIKLVETDSSQALAFLPLLADHETSIHVRVGIGAVLESVAGLGELSSLVEGIGELSADADPRTRQDACHYLGLTASASAAAYLEVRSEDEDALVREIAAESLEALAAV